MPKRIKRATANIVLWGHNTLLHHINISLSHVSVSWSPRCGPAGWLSVKHQINNCFADLDLYPCPCQQTDEKKSSSVGLQSSVVVCIVRWSNCSFLFNFFFLGGGGGGGGSGNTLRLSTLQLIQVLTPALRKLLHVRILQLVSISIFQSFWRKEVIVKVRS